MTIMRTFTVEDFGMMTSSCIQTITLDNPPPTPVCNPISVTLDPMGQYTLTQMDIDNIAAGSSDLCGMVTYGVDRTMLTCADFPSTQVTLTVTDDCGDMSTCMATITVNDPSMVCCIFTATCPMVTDLGSFDCTQLGNIPALPTTQAEAEAPPYNIVFGPNPCGTITVQASDDITMYDVCAMGGQTVTRTVVTFDDLNGNGMADMGESSETCTYTFDILEDTNPPTIVCPPTETIMLLPGECDFTYVYDVTGIDDCNAMPTLMQVQGPPSGTALEEFNIANVTQLKNYIALK